MNRGGRLSDATLFVRDCKYHGKRRFHLGCLAPWPGTHIPIWVGCGLRRASRCLAVTMYSWSKGESALMTSAALRMRRFRKQKPELAKAIDKRRTDARRREEEAARAYVASYLRRGRIVPPAACDECGDLSDRLRPW